MTSRPAILVTGGAGYVGSHVVLAFRDAGYPLVVLDDLSTGLRMAVPSGTPFVKGDVGDSATVSRVIREYGVKTVIHLAARSSVPESIGQPLDYYNNNTIKSELLLRSCLCSGVESFLFASSAAVYGAPSVMPVREDTPALPLHPYGRSKLATEWMLGDVAPRHGMRYAALRYFNVAGADLSGRAGQSSRGAAHLVKAACAAAVGACDGLTVFGTDYKTPDGTCVRDYIHVSDLAAAHVAVLQGLQAGHPGGVFNCGADRGASVREVIDAVGRAAGTCFLVREAARRVGDPAILVGDSSLLRSEFSFSPRFDDLGLIALTAVAWERDNPSRASSGHSEKHSA